MSGRVVSVAQSQPPVGCVLARSGVCESVRENAYGACEQAPYLMFPQQKLYSVFRCSKPRLNAEPVFPFHHTSPPPPLDRLSCLGAICAVNFSDTPHIHIVPHRAFTSKTEELENE